MIATRPMPYRLTANESLPPIFAPDDSIIVTIGEQSYPGMVVGIVDDEYVRVSYSDATFADEFGNPLIVERNMPMDAIEPVETCAQGDLK